VILQLYWIFGVWSSGFFFFFFLSKEKL